MRLFLTKMTLFAMIILFACKQKNYPYPQNRGISNEQGILKDSLGFYFSAFEPFDSSQEKLVKDTFWQQYLSTNLYAFKEPVWFNDYLGKEQYRFLWLRSFHYPMVFTISNNEGNIQLNTKKLDRFPLFRDELFDPGDNWSDSYYVALGYHPQMETDTLENGRIDKVEVIKADRKANIVYNSTKPLTQENWGNFKKLLRTADFWKQKPFHWWGATDGAVWVIEANTKKGYKYLIRQSPGPPIRNIGELLIQLSGLNEEIY